MKRINTYLLFLGVVIAFVSGCRSYEPKPIDWECEARVGVTNEITITSLEDASVIALIGNRNLNALRLKAANSSKVAKETGWWEDPEIDFDIMRIVNPGDHPFLGGGSLAFTIPLSGALKLDEKAAQIYAKADFADITASETEVSANAQKLAIRIDSLRKRVKMLSNWSKDERVQNARANIEKLHEAGEVTSSELARVRRAMHALRHDIMENEKEIAAAEIDLLRLCGLRPETKIKINLDDTKDISMPNRKSDPLDLVKHPKVLAALIRFNGTEHALHAEIRRQYPDLKLGPAYANEEGLDRFGLVAGISIPLWNRNRKGIAEAESRRDEVRLSAIDTWYSLVCDVAEARANLIRLLEHPPFPASEHEQTEKLANAGELTPLEYFDIREEIIKFELAHADWRRDVALANAELANLEKIHESR